ncbi:hypothetical protein [Okeania sp. SIO2B3]|uniref:hypothetical protein n=1 Tax=Okeania sp. SIO2B3 TaxID=2607784 RepID=UPI0013BFA6A7|nr:hypothetical protein [Okeania sp. SIO2B3]NET45708.1 hypothetical protein [Okeania sp. SIO2B3]
MIIYVIVTISFLTILGLLYILFQPNNRKFNPLAESIYLTENEDAENGSTIPPN